MLMYGDSKNIINTGYVYNITSYLEGYIRLNALIPPNELGRFTGKDFDIVYADYIMSNDWIFKQFFDIIYNLYIGNDVYLIASPEDWSENLVESLLKLIQQRYGYNAIKINSPDDYWSAFNSKYQSEFNPDYGLYNLDIDKERYTFIVEMNRIRCGGKVIMEDPDG